MVSFMLTENVDSTIIRLEHLLLPFLSRYPKGERNDKQQIQEQIQQLHKQEQDRLFYRKNV